MESKIKKYILLSVIVGILIILRVFSLSLPYHQDEYKIARAINPATGTPGAFLTHPPLSEIAFILDGKIFGYDNLRFLPFLLGILNCVLIYFLVRRRFGEKAALWSSFFFSISFYSVLASLMVDTDGQILPTFFLLSLSAYYKWREADTSRRKIIWSALLGVSALAGFMVKLSFILAIATLAVDFIYSKRLLLRKKDIINYSFILGGGLVFLTIAIFSVHFIYPPFNLGATASHARYYMGFFGRGYMQILIQTLKALMYLSPALALSVFFLNRKRVGELKIFYIFLSLSFIFYYILFDFSKGALDKYLMLTIIPLAIMGGVAAADLFEDKDKKINYSLIISALLLCILIFSLQFAPHFAPPLHPKTLWLHRLFTGRWNFLFPFTGGNGPVGFYISFLFIGLAYVFSIASVIASFIKREWKKTLWIMIFLISLVYNINFIEEFTFGWINGSPKTVIKGAIDYIARDKNIDSVFTYNDIGTYELFKIQKIHGRFYVAPQFTDNNRKRLNDFKGYYLVVDIPKIDPNSIYARYFLGCQLLYKNSSGEISAKVYDCRNAKDVD